jgi:hypothetical protein
MLNWILNEKSAKLIVGLFQLAQYLFKALFCDHEFFEGLEFLERLGKALLRGS